MALGHGEPSIPQWHGIIVAKEATMAVWDDVLSDRDKAVYEAAGFGKKRN